MLCHALHRPTAIAVEIPLQLAIAPVAGRRASRPLPTRFVCVPPLGGARALGPTSKAFREDAQHFEAFEAGGDHHAGVKEICQRSIFKLQCVRQDLAILRKHSWELGEGVLNHFRRVHSRVISSQIVEDAFNRQKNNKKEPNRRGIVERSWGVLVEKSVASEVHKFKEPAISDDPVEQQALGDEVFHAKLRDSPKEFHELTSFRAKTAWWSPGPQGFTQSYGACEVRAGAGLEEGHPQLVLGGTLSGPPPHLGPSPPRRRCALGVVLRHAPLARDMLHGLACRSSHRPDRTGVFYRPRSRQVGVSQVLVPVLDLTKWEAMPYEWKSPFGLVTQHRGVLVEAWGDWSIMAAPTCEPAALLDIACKQGFWSLKAPFLLRLAQHIEVPLPENPDLIEILECLLRSVLHLEENDLLSFLDRRIQAMSYWSSRAKTETSMESRCAGVLVHG